MADEDFLELTFEDFLLDEVAVAFFCTIYSSFGIDTFISSIINANNEKETSKNAVKTGPLFASSKEDRRPDEGK